MGFDFQSLEVELFFRGQAAPDVRRQTDGNEKVAGGAHRVGDDPGEGVGLAALALARQLVRHVHVFDGAVAGQHPQRRGVGGELVVGIGEVGRVAVVQVTHGGKLALHLRFDLGHHLVQEGGVGGSLFAQHHEDGALHVVAFLRGRIPSRWRWSTRR